MEHEANMNNSQNGLKTEIRTQHIKTFQKEML